MLPIPDLDQVSIAFGSIDHMPKRENLPEEFQKNWHRSSNKFCDAVSTWFYDGAKKIPNGVEVDGVKFIAKDGVDAAKALRAIQAALGSFEPSHEHKIGGCGYMLSEWFDIEKAK